MRVALFGSPAFAVPVLDALLEEHDVVAVVTQPARPVGRGLKLRQPALAAHAAALGIPLKQPTRLRRDEAFREFIASLELDVAVTAAYGRILPAGLLEVPRHGFLNVHASLLPRWRGAAPIQWALIQGDSVTGISVMQTETGLDTGPVRHVLHTGIHPHETAPELFARLADLGAEAIVQALRLLASSSLPSVPQDDSLATLAPLLTRNDGRLDFRRSAADGYNRYRGVAAWPGSWFPYLGADVKALGMSPVMGRTGPPGDVLEVSAAGLLVACGQDALLLQELQSPGRKRLPAQAWASGAQVRPGSSLLSLEE